MNTEIARRVGIFIGISFCFMLIIFVGCKLFVLPSLEARAIIQETTSDLAAHSLAHILKSSAMVQQPENSRELQIATTDPDILDGIMCDNFFKLFEKIHGCRVIAKKIRMGIFIEGAQDNQYGSGYGWLSGEVRYFPNKKQLFFVLNHMEDDNQLVASPVSLVLYQKNPNAYKLYISKKYQLLKIE